MGDADALSDLMLGHFSAVPQGEHSPVGDGELSICQGYASTQKVIDAITAACQGATIK